MLENSAEDKRVFERKNFSTILRFRTAAGKTDGEGITRNISAGGLSFITKQRVRPKDAIDMWIGIPDGRIPLHKAAQVVWARENLVDTYEAGVRFDSVGLMELSRIFKTS